MLVGLMSDSHDRVAAVEGAVKLFNESAVDFVLHAGDHVAPFVVRRYQGLKAPWRGVFGNNDGERRGLMLASGGRIGGDVLRLELGGCGILLVHRREDGLALAASGRLGPVDVLVCGHTHEKGRWEEEGIVVVNPGETCGYVSGSPTVALLDTETKQVEWVALEVGAVSRG